MSEAITYCCRIDSNEENNTRLLVKEMMLGTKEQFEYFVCGACGCIQIAEFPKNISDYYSQDSYYSFEKTIPLKLKGGIGKFHSMIVKANVLPVTLIDYLLGKIFPNRLVKFLTGYVENRESRILDVGSGNGMKFLYPLYQAGFRNILGCDPYLEEELIYPNGLKITNQDLSSVEGNWDLICFNHSFEHIWNPKHTLTEVFERLDAKGTCILRIPVASSYAWEHYGVHWFQLDAPRHYFLHTVKSIKHLAAKTGFDLEKIVYDSTHHQFTISERYKRGRTLKERNYTSALGRIFHLFKKLQYHFKAQKLNRQERGDQAVFYLRKKE